MRQAGVGRGEALQPLRRPRSERSTGARLGPGRRSLRVRARRRRQRTAARRRDRPHDGRPDPTRAQYRALACNRMAGDRRRALVAASLVHAVFAYALSFLGVFLIAVIVDLLAPSFEGKRDALAALKVTVYSFTPGWVAAIFSIVPVLGVLAILGALYGLYLLYLGLPVLMRCPHEKSVGYTFVTVLCAIVTWIVIAALSTCAVGGLGLIGVGVLSRMGR